MTAIVGGVILFMHDFFTVIWVGGLLFITVTILPVLKSAFGHSSDTEKIMDAIMKKHSKLVLISIFGLVVTGLLLSRGSPEFSGLLNFNDLFNSILSIKHIFTILMILITFVRFFGFRNLALMADKKRKQTSLFLLFANTVLGVAVLFLSGLMAYI